MTTLRIQHVSIPRPPGAASAQIARAFYGELLGLSEIPLPPTHTHADLVWFQIGDGELHVFGEESFDNHSTRHFCLEVDDLKALGARLAGAGYVINAGSVIAGRPRFFCRDPFHNNVEFTTIVGDYRNG
jgi:catechol 2,3-dioxygenase-like lactoylglutathione lyase family enzyme